METPALPTRPSPWLRRISLLQDALLIVVSFAFAYIQAPRALSGHPVNIGFFCDQLLLAFMFLLRRRSRSTSARPLDWVFAAGGWLTMATRPGEAGPTAEVVGGSIQVVGLCLTAIGFLYLGRSFGVVAADRGVKIHGPYRFVRHPIYFAHLVTYIGVMIANPVPWNYAICALTLACQVWRMAAEERHLSSRSEDYREYRSRVRWRLVPGVY